MSLAEATMAYQAILETKRRIDGGSLDVDDYEQVLEDVANARRAMEVAWLERSLGA